jgi:putative thioredoxin
MDFKIDVIQASYKKPIVVDFWAPWCGPCRFLGPVIEQIADEQKDRWTLVKVNTEEHQDLSAQFNIRSIPNVKMFRNGEPVAEFMGALPKNAIQQWLDDHLPSEEKDELDSLISNMGELPDTNTISALEAFLVKYPENANALFLKTQHQIFIDHEPTLDAVETLKQDSRFFEQAYDLQTLYEIFNSPFEEETKVAKIMASAKEALLAHDFKTGITALIDGIIADKEYQDALPRRGAIAVFRSLGLDHPITLDLRKKFEMALY